MLPPKPIIPLVKEEANWPRTRVTRGPFDSVVRTKKSEESANSRFAAVPSLGDVDDGEEVGAAWGDDDLDLSGDDEPRVQEGGADSAEEGETEHEGDGWGGEDELDLDELIEENAPAETTAAIKVTLPPPGPQPTETWARNSVLAADQVAAGKFDVAMRLLHEQIGAIKFEALKPAFMEIYRARTVLLPLMSGLPPMRSFLDRNRTKEDFHPRSALPRLVLPLFLFLSSCLPHSRLLFRHALIN